MTTAARAPIIAFMWLVLSLLTAFFVSLQDIFNKRAVREANPYVVAWGWSVFALPFLIPLYFLDEIPVLGVSFWEVAGMASFLLVFALICYVKALEASDVSISVPMLTFTPLLLLITSPIMLGEFPSRVGLVGIILIVAGAYALFFGELHKGFLGPLKGLLADKGARYMLLVAIVFSISANFDKMGTLLSTPVAWVTITYVMISLGLTIVLLMKRIDFVSEMKKCWRLLLVIGLFNALGLVCQMYAVRLEIVPYVIAIKRMSVFMTSMAGFIFFKEQNFQERILGCLLMLLGAFLISFR